MGKRKRKGKSVKNNTNRLKEPEELVQAPHSFVIHKGLTGGFVEDLTRDFRKVMEPFTASSLKERKSNTIKDFVHVAGVLHVSHLCIFSRTDVGVYLKLGKIPRGPTLTFKVHDFALARDVLSSLKRQVVVQQAFKSSPLIVLNNFSGEGMQFKLMASIFQNMFPTLNLQNVDLNTVRRVVMLNYNTDTKRIDFRHYAIKIIPVGISRGVKKVVRGAVPDLSKCHDIADFLIKAGNASDTEGEEDPNAEITLAQKMASRGNLEAGKSAVKLSELGPRISLQLIKIEDGLMDGEVLYHDLVQKSDEEKAAIKKARDAKRRLKEKRRKIQDANTRRKELEKEQHKEKSLQGMKKTEDGTAEEKPAELKGILKNGRKRAFDDGVVEEEDDDAQYYREEVGEEPDKDLFASKSSGFSRPPKTFHAFKKRRMDDRKSGGGKNFPENKKSFGGNFKGKRQGGDFHGKKQDGDFRGRKQGGDFRGRKQSGDFRGKKQGGKKPRAEKTNAGNRDFRPIGGMKTGVRKFTKQK